MIRPTKRLRILLLEKLTFLSLVFLKVCQSICNSCKLYWENQKFLIQNFFVLRQYTWKQSYNCLNVHEGQLAMQKVTHQRAIDGHKHGNCLH